MTVTATPIAPTAAADTATVAEGKSILVDVLANDTGTGLTLTESDAPQHGVATISNGEILYTAAGAYIGTDTFNYTITGAAGQTATSSLTVTITAATGPVAAADTATVTQGGAVLIDVLGNDTGTGLVLTRIGQPQYGTTTIQNGQVLYIASTSYAGLDAFTYTETDINGQTATSSVAVTVTMATSNTPPTVSNPTVTVAGNAAALPHRHRRALRSERPGLCADHHPHSTTDERHRLAGQRRRGLGRRRSHGNPTDGPVLHPRPQVASARVRHSPTRSWTRPGTAPPAPPPS